MKIFVVMALLMVAMVAPDVAVSQKSKRAQVVYACPMHPDVTSSKRGRCRKCGMDLKAVKKKAELVAEYRRKFASPYVAAERGYIDDVIEPKETRPRLINALEMLSNKRDSNPAKKHGNIPL